MSNKVDLTGKRFGRLIVLEHIGYKCFPSGRRHLLWKCKCDCGNFTNVTTEKLKSCSTRSCGCLAREIRSKRKGQNATNYKKGITFTRLGYIYLGIKQRCYNPNNQNYHNYGGRGITMCDEWLGEHGFENFRTTILVNSLLHFNGIYYIFITIIILANSFCSVNKYCNFFVNVIYLLIYYTILEKGSSYNKGSSFCPKVG